ncbi:MAG: hypothetical protein AAF235_06345 [Planctomycetota bacterium]
MNTRTIAVLSAFALAIPASAQTTELTPRGSISGPFVPGNGNGSDNFAVYTIEETTGAFAGNTMEIGLKAKERFFGDGNVGGTGTLYIVQDGVSPEGQEAGAADSDDAWWNFDLSIFYGSRSIADTLVTVTITDPENDIAILPFAITPNVFDGTESAVQTSQNIGFDFIAAAGLGPFDSTLLGDYIFDVTIEDIASGGTPVSLGEFQVIARVVPTPGAVSLLALSGIAGAQRRRR